MVQQRPASALIALAVSSAVIPCIPAQSPAAPTSAAVPLDLPGLSAAIGEAMDQLELGRSVLIFPEEGRSRDGHLLELQRGGFLLALKSGLPILPVGIEGAIEAMPPDQLLFHPGPVAVRFGTPIETAGLKVSARRELMAQVQDQLETLTQPLGLID